MALASAAAFLSDQVYAYLDLPHPRPLFKKIIFAEGTKGNVEGLRAQPGRLFEARPQGRPQGAVPE
ncbi:MAG: hypothetical protein A2156_03855 [Deltaproteobacteria bacterium RBG_16_48_10]|nr:MAG: hypothetical protein A2156_03855 [Deltaproteobacteria bacterium RBG_16_48_10]